MGKTIFNETIKGKEHVATQEDDHILVKADGKEHRYSPSYSANELKAALADPEFNQAKAEALNG